MVAGEGSILAILYASVSASVAITTPLRTVYRQLSEICNEIQELRTTIHDLSSRVANELATHQDIRPSSLSYVTCHIV